MVVRDRKNFFVRVVAILPDDCPEEVVSELNVRLSQLATVNQFDRLDDYWNLAALEVGHQNEMRVFCVKAPYFAGVVQRAKHWWASILVLNF